MSEIRHGQTRKGLAYDSAGLLPVNMYTILFLLDRPFPECKGLSGTWCLVYPPLCSTAPKILSPLYAWDQVISLVLGFYPRVQLSFSVSSMISRKLNFISLFWFAFSWTVISPSWLKQEWFAYYTLSLSGNCIKIGDIMGCLLSYSLHNAFLIGQLQWTKHLGDI